jgi:peptidyl-prolyl cis-trans isomerase A (cyclophilin A)
MKSATQDERRDMGKRLILAVALAFLAGMILPGPASSPIAAPQQEGSEQKESEEKEMAKSVEVDRKALLDPKSPEMNKQSPEEFKVKFETSKGDVVIKVTRSLSPLGADRFYNLVRNGFYNEVRFFRVISGFMAQFGLSGDAEISKAWYNAVIKDEPAKASNTRGMVTYAMRGANTRTTQLFISYGNNSFLDKQGFTPFGEVVEGMEVVDSFYAEYGEGPPRGEGANQQRIQAEGNVYLIASFPKLDYIKKVYVLE